MREGIESKSNLRSRQYRLILSLGLSHFSPGFWHLLFPVTMAWSSPIVAVLESMCEVRCMEISFASVPDACVCVAAPL